MWSIVLFYKYVGISDPKSLMESQRALCERLCLKGRTIIAEEGINSTLGGKAEDVLSYVEEMKKDPRFEDIDYKISPGVENSFPKLSVKVRPEIVTLGATPKARGKYISPKELHDWFEGKNKDFIVVDMRNNYEHASGLFKDSIPAPIQNFRELKTALPQLENLKNKTVVTVCTGGIRCEKASGYLVDNGFQDVYQLHGGIHRYIEEFPEGHFKGALYVFDGRVVMKPEEAKEIIGKCLKCGSPSEKYVNCANLSCHLHFICCEKCGVEGEVVCKEECKNIAAGI